MKKLLFLLIMSFMLSSCARVGSPAGGSRDTIPPVLVRSNIDTARVNVPLNIKKLRLDFNEYVTLKDIQNNLIISPPIKYKKIIPTSLGNKYIEIEWDEQLKENTTYNFNFGNSITDLNEGNILPYFNYAFSTGPQLDKTYISGEIHSGYTRATEKGNADNFVVGLYLASDSLDFTKKPYYVTRADDDGYYELNYISPGKYRLLAYRDTDKNSVFTDGKDEVYFEKEVLDLEKSISGKNINTYPSKKKVKFLDTKELDGGAMLNFEGHPENVSVTSQTDKLKDYKVTHKKFSDSVFVWFDVKQLELPKNNNENLKFKYQADTLEGNASMYYKANVKTEFALNNSSGSSIPPKQQMTILSSYPINKINTEKWVMKVDSTTIQDFKAHINDQNPYEIIVESNFIPEKKYAFNVPKETVETYYQKLPKSYQFNFDVDKTQNYGSLELRFKAIPKENFWVQLLTESNEVKYSRLVHSNSVKFSALSPATYYVRILVDNNGNGRWDEADLKNEIPAEDVYLLDKLIEIRPLWENIEDQWNPFQNEDADKSNQPEDLPTNSLPNQNQVHEEETP